MVSGVACCFSASATAAGAPATCGLAIEVPLMAAVAVSPECPAPGTSTPGAMMSTQRPRLLNDAMLSFLSLAATVTAPGTRAGDHPQASSGTPISGTPLPAATTTVTDRKSVV